MRATVEYYMSFLTLKPLLGALRARWSLILLTSVLVGQGLFALVVGVLLFYRNGIYFLDAGYYVYTLASQNFGSQPPAIGNSAGTSLFDTHMLITPLLISQIFRTVARAPLNFIMYLGLQHVVLAVAGSLMMLVIFHQNGAKKSQTWFPMLLGAFFLPFSNIGLGSLLYPHVEVMGTSLVAIGVLLLILRWSGIKNKSLLILLIVTMVLGLMTRQDIGVHLVITVASALACARWKLVKRSAAKTTLYLFLTGFAFSVVLMSYQQIFFGEHNVFSVSYSGTPAYAHISSIWYLLDRVLFLLASRLDLIIGLGAFTLAAIVLRRREYLAFPIAVIPWILLNVTAIDPAKNSMGIYHLFPIILYATAPILAVSLSRGSQPSVAATQQRLVPMYATYGVAIMSLFLGGISAPPTGFGYLFTNVLRLPMISPSEITATHKAIEVFAASDSRISVDNAVMTIRPVILKDVPLMPTIENASEIDSVLFFARYVTDQESREKIFNSWVQENRLISITCLPGGLVQADAEYPQTEPTNQSGEELMGKAQQCHPQPQL